MNTAAVNLISCLSAVGVGIIFAALYLLLWSQRRYLLYAGVAFIILGISLILLAPLRWVVVGLACLAFIYAIILGVRETSAGLRTLQEENREREQAFAEYLESVTRSETEKEDTPPPG